MSFWLLKEIVDNLHNFLNYNFLNVWYNSPVWAEFTHQSLVLSILEFINY